MTDQNQAPTGADPETPKDQYSDSWFETQLWPQLSKLDALHELLYCSADGLSEAAPSAEAWRGFATLLKDIHTGIRSALENWTEFNFMRRAWMPHEATVSLQQVEGFVLQTLARMQPGDEPQPGRLTIGRPIIDVPVREIVGWLEECYHSELAYGSGALEGGAQ